MTTITLTIPDEFAREPDSFDLLEILKMGWVYYQTKQTLKTRKIIAPSRRVRPKRHKVDPQQWHSQKSFSADTVSQELDRAKNLADFLALEGILADDNDFDMAMEHLNQNAI